MLFLKDHSLLANENETILNSHDLNDIFSLQLSYVSLGILPARTTKPQELADPVVARSASRKNLPMEEMLAWVTPQ